MVKPKIGDARIVRKFIWFKTIGTESVILEHASYKQIYLCDDGKCKWYDVEWC